ncbi:hypothetical protein R3W88_027657 [Solanum pinnatisectum]|uniref:NB-ARC domain-containing protein n=1 Tax=Solanum pinnatisectum TaxID=50273 RepID=A0AAV9LHC1_9SOLN|nr:hypothetical protein R3W88_027657 [Solanum pinnatisectum]
MKRVASTVAADLHMLGKLTEDHCWSILKQKAFVDGRVPEELTSMGNKIVKMCQGLPLAANVKIMILEKIAYVYLPSPQLKKCFAYFAIFPKDFEFEKEQLIQLWMAEGFFCPCQETTVMEDVGHRFFQILLQNSLLQDVVLDEHNNITHGKMHDLVHDLARNIFKSKVFDPKGNDGGKLSHVRYFGCESPRDKIDKINEPECLCTLFWRSNYISEDMPLSFKFLKVLNLSSSGIKKLSAKIGKLIYLRINDCDSLKELPYEMGNMISLRHIYCSFQFFKAGLEKGHQIEELGHLKNLRGELTINGLQLVNDREEARTIYLQEKSNIYKLAYVWFHDEPEGSKTDDEYVLDGLQPHPNLKTLAVVDYLGTKFPSWFHENLLPNLVKLKLSGCKKCKEIPSLGQLKLLRHLELLGFREVESIGPRFYGIDGNNNGSSNNIQEFPSLKELILEDMSSLIEWKEMKLGNLTSLVELSVYAVKELTCFPDEMLHNNVSLQNLMVSGCIDFCELPQSLYNLHSH